MGLLLHPQNVGALCGGVSGYKDSPNLVDRPYGCWLKRNSLEVAKIVRKPRICRVTFRDSKEQFLENDELRG